MPFSVISRARKPVPQNKPTPMHITVVAISDAYGVLPRQSSQSHIATSNINSAQYVYLARKIVNIILHSMVVTFQKSITQCENQCDSIFICKSTSQSCGPEIRGVVRILFWKVHIFPFDAIS